MSGSKCDNCGIEIDDAYFNCEKGAYCSDACHEIAHPEYYEKTAEGRHISRGHDERRLPYCIRCRTADSRPAEGNELCNHCRQVLGLKTAVETVQKK